MEKEFSSCGFDISGIGEEERYFTIRRLYYWTSYLLSHSCNFCKLCLIDDVCSNIPDCNLCDWINYLDWNNHLSNFRLNYTKFSQTWSNYHLIRVYSLLVLYEVRYHISYRAKNLRFNAVFFKMENKIEWKFCNALKPRWNIWCWY